MNAPIGPVASIALLSLRDRSRLRKLFLRACHFLVSDAAAPVELGALEEGEEAAALEVGAGVDAPFAAAPLELALSFDGVSVFVPAAGASFFGDAYKSEYQPPPLSTKEVRLMQRDSAPLSPQPSHFSGGGSCIFWKTSVILPQLLQTYS
jgi:hypothetical protein